MTPIYWLRSLLVSAYLLAIGAGVANTFTVQWLASGVAEPFNALLASKPRLGLSFIVMSAIYEVAVLAAVIGMCMGRRWGRMLGVAVTAVTMVQAIVLGPHAYTGIAFMLSYASKVAWGAGLASAFWMARMDLQRAASESRTSISPR